MKVNRRLRNEMCIRDRFKPVDINFTKPNWDTIMTKRDKPAMSEEEFDEAIKELARKRCV